MSFPNPTNMRGPDWTRAFSRNALDLTVTLSSAVVSKSRNLVQGWARPSARGYPMTAALGSTSTTVTDYRSGNNFMY